MDAIGNLEVAWAQGYAGSRLDYVNKDTICYQCGNQVKFMTEQGQELSYTAPGNGITAFAVHNINKVIATAELSLKPRIHISSYPDFKESCVLEDGASLEYSMLAFSTSDYLAAVTGVPEFELLVWNYVTGQLMCRASLPHVKPTSISFNPGNWRQIFVTTEREMFTFNVEEADTKHFIHKSRVRRPTTDGCRSADDGEKERDESTARVSRDTAVLQKMQIEMPLMAIAQLTKEDTETFSELQDQTPRVVPVCHTWQPSGDVIIGCSGGQLLRVDGDSLKVRVLKVLSPKEPSMLTKDKKQVSILESREGRDGTMLGDGISLGDGNADTLALHKDGLFVGGKDGSLRLLHVSSETVKMKGSFATGKPIKSLAFSTTYRHLAVGTATGQVFLYDHDNPTEVVELFDVHHGQFVDMACLAPGSQMAASIREDGEVQLWNVETGKLAGCTSLGIQAHAIACSPLARQVMIGTRTGHMYVLDACDVTNIRIVARPRIHEGPLTHLEFDVTGTYLFSAGTDSRVFVMDGRPTKNWSILGHTDFPGEIQTLSVYGDTRAKTIKVVLTSSTDDHKKPGANKLMSFEIKEKLFYSEDDAYQNKMRKDFRAEAINKMVLNFTHGSYGTAATMQNVVFAFAHRNRKLQKITLPDEPPQKLRPATPPEMLKRFMGDAGTADDDDVPEEIRKYREACEAMSKASYIEGQEWFEGHGLPGAFVRMSPHQKWLASGGPDGQIQLRSVGALDRYVSVSPHDHRIGGVKTFVFSLDGQHVLSTGYDGSLVCFKWNYTSFGLGKGKAAADFAGDLNNSQGMAGREEDEALKALATWHPGTPAAGAQPEGEDLDESQEQAKRDAIKAGEVYTTPTPTPGSGSTLLQVWEAEAIREEDKLYADVKTQLRSEIRDMRQTIQSMMKENEEVPAVEQLGHEEFDLDLEEQAKLKAEGEEEVAKLRDEIEMENLARQYLRELIKTEAWEDMAVKGRSVLAFMNDIKVANYPMKERTRAELAEFERVSSQRKVEMEEAKARKDTAEEAARALTSEDTDNLGEEEEAESGDGNNVHGSLGAEYGGGSELFYSQLELNTREQKMNQIVLLQDALYRIRTAFNKEFDVVYDKRESEFAKIKDKNKRIRKILEDLSHMEEVCDPQWTALEKPETLFTVKDEEVKVEKFLTPEQKKALEEQERVEEEARAKARADNWRERGLDMMMGGVLEIRKEDELKKDIPIPRFMTEKKEEDWSEEEQKLAKEYEAKVKELLEEREKYRKQLEAELKKLQTQIEEGKAAFDDALLALFSRKIKTEMVINQEELTIMRLKYSLLLEEEFDFWEAELHRELQHKIKCRDLTKEALKSARQHEDAFKEQYDILVAEDRVLDRHFKREFSDVTAVQADQLQRLFKKRPRGHKLGVKGETPIFDAKAGNPFAERPSTARQLTQTRRGLDAAMKELDNETNTPENVSYDTWQRFCQYRRQKIESEQLCKQKANVMADMKAFVQRRQDDDAKLGIAIHELEQAINKVKEDRMRFSCNLEMQLVMKQGQVEVEAGAFIPDFTRSILVHRSIVEDLNATIRQLGEGKIASMEEAKDFKKGIVQLEWEHRKMSMMMADLANRVRDISQFKVTREVQAYLNNDDYDNKKQQDISVLEQTILMLRKHHEKNVEERKRTIRDLDRVIRSREDDLGVMDDQMEESNVSVNERRHIHQVNADKRSDAGRDLRYTEIVQRRKLVDLAKAQAQEVAVLRAEVERLRMRTFPALVQVER